MRELRFAADAQISVRGSGHTQKIDGYATIYGGAGYPVFERGKEFTETMAHGAARDVVAGKTYLFVNHNDETLALARSPKTMRLSDDSRGLHFSAQLDTRQQHARDTLIAIEREDMTGVSVGMVVGRDEWNSDRSERVITRLAELPEISLVNFPANPAASVQLAQRMAKRAGRVLSQENAEHILEAHRRLGVVLDAAGIKADPEGDGLTDMIVNQDAAVSSATSLERARELIRDEPVDARAVAEVRAMAWNRERMAQRLLWLEHWAGNPAVDREIYDLTMALRRNR